MNRWLRLLSAFVGTSALMGLLVAMVVSPVFLLAGAGARSSAQWFDDLPDELPAAPLPTPSRILAADGTLIASFYSENRILVTFDQLPVSVRDAVLSIEDHRFYEHGPIDGRGFLRAVGSNLAGGSQGASTLTQQYVKNVLITEAVTEEDLAAATETTLGRKLREASYAVRVEETMSKDDILAGYLNISYFGAGAYGVGAAAQRYFSVPVQDLTLSQSALLAGLVQSPEYLNPLTNLDAATRRRNTVLMRMADVGKISVEESRRAMDEPVVLAPSQPANGCTSSRWPQYCESVKNILRFDPTFGATPEARERLLYRGGLVIHTNLDPAVQDAAQAAVDAGLGRDNRVAGALAIVQPGTGKVLAMAQNRTFGAREDQPERETEINLAMAPAMQTGSAFKPFTLAAALESGWDFDATLDAPRQHCVGPEGSKHCVMNNDDAPYTRGPLTASQAIARSSNTFFTVMTEKYGVAKVVDTARRAGLTFDREPGEGDITVTLGTYETSPLAMANGYATLLGHGVACDPMVIASVTGPDGSDLRVPGGACRQAIEPRVADQVVQAMRATVDPSEPFRLGIAADPGFAVAGKSGTTNSHAAIWFAGGTPDVSAALWMGDPRGGFEYPIDEVRVYGKVDRAAYGSTAAGPVWRETLKAVQPLTPQTPFAPVSVSSTRQVVPDVRGMSDVAAFGVLRRAGFSPVLAGEQSAGAVALPPDVVTGSVPAHGASAGAGDVVQVVMSPGSRTDLVEPPR